MNRTNPIIKYYQETDGSYQKWGNPQAYELHYGYHNPPTLDHLQALEQMNQVVAESARIQPGDHVLDMGCGVGASAIWLAKHKQTRVHGITLVKEQADKANAFAASHGVSEHTAFSIADFTQTPFEDCSFDVIWGIESLCHAESKRNVFREANRLLRPGGRIVFADYFLNKPINEFSELEQHTLQRWLAGWAIPHLSDLDTLNEELKTVGFQTIQFNNITEFIRPSAKEIYKRGQEGFPNELFTHNNSVTQLKHVEACLFQYVCLKQELWSYLIVTATK